VFVEAPLLGCHVLCDFRLILKDQEMQVYQNELSKKKPIKARWIRLLNYLEKRIC
jgi:hypothetical protein